MGLDMNLYAKVNGENQEVHYWRKHANFHGFMEKIWREKGGEGEFNCVELALNEELISRIETAIKEKSLPQTSGFFFGKSYGNQDERDDDLEAMSKARQLIREGTTVVYQAWY